ncbi:MAG: sn-glycerol-3-phosphate ABC transporter ATP-binding protein UgpC [Christensenellaceae bacterium]|nr:sn-glycerol-3-phosphate ABC transporter ATP-binding protein UgpC [Christensenellaceae bacterium]
MANITLKNIKKTYPNGFVAVHDFNLEIQDKEFIVLVGPSGCGKSTTLRMIAGLEDITSGELHIDEKLMNDVAPKDRDIAMVFQNYALYPHMTVFENMAFALKLRHMKKDQIKEKVHEAAAILGIEDLLERKPKALSGGQRQRVAIGRAIVREPKAFLMDEPLSNLDAKLRNQMRAEILKLRQRIDTTFIYVTHDQTEAMTLGDRIVIMKDGYIQQIGTPQELFNKPANLFVAGFIGTPQMNFFNAEIKNNNVIFMDVEYKLPVEKDLADQDVTIGIRPEYISLCPEDAKNTLCGTVSVTEMMGSEIYIHVDVQGKNMIMRVPTTDVYKKYPEGIVNSQQIKFTFQSELLQVFDKETEKSLLY